MPKIRECDHCQYFASTPYMVCGVHPSGPAGSTCKDFCEIAVSGTAPRQPIGGGYYADDWIPQPFPALTPSEQLALLDQHPQFTGRCPNCETPIAEAIKGKWRCRYCGWEYARPREP